MSSLDFVRPGYKNNGITVQVICCEDQKFLMYFRRSINIFFQKASVQCLLFLFLSFAAGNAEERTYQNRLTRIQNPKPLLADFPKWVEPIRETNRFEGPILVYDKDADLSVRAWRYSYKAHGIIEMPNRLRAKNTAVILVHPWGIDDGQGWKTPEPAGVCDFCTPQKNHLAGKHTRKVINPFLKSVRKKVGLVAYSMPGNETSIHKKLYRSFRGKPTNTERQEGAKELKQKLTRFLYQGETLPVLLQISRDKPVVDYFNQFKGLDAVRFNPKGFWELPIPVASDVEVDPDDIVIYDGEGYPALKQNLDAHGIRHVLLLGYATDICYAHTCAGFENLTRDFNVFLVGDATLSSFPASDTPRLNTSAHICSASLDHLITQLSWIRFDSAGDRRPSRK